MDSIVEEKKFYQLLLSKIEKDMADKGITLQQLADSQTDYFISHGQYYNIKGIANDKKKPFLSIARMEKVCNYLGIKFKRLYQIDEITTK